MNPRHSIFEGRVLGVATMHEKERAIRPPFLERFPLEGCRVVEGLDTDAFGAFTGERRRTLDPRATAEAKARAGAEKGGFDLVIASEGSFVPHPATPFLTCDEEWLVLLDLAEDTVRVHRHVSLDVVCGGRELHSLAEVESYAASLPFPEHRLVVRPRQTFLAGDPVYKGIASLEELESAWRSVWELFGQAWVEVDLRAHANPTRMRAIERAAREFALELARACPACEAPHFRVTEALRGLPCLACGEPTQALLTLVRACEACGERREEGRPDGKEGEDPMYCEFCNP